MNTLSKEFISPGKQNFIWLGITLGLTYWVMESWIHVFFFQEGDLAAQLLTSDIHEIWKRLLVLSLFTLFGLYFQFSIRIRKKTEAALHEREKELSLIMENNPAGIMLVDAAFKTISLVNSNAQKMIGLPRNRIEGQSSRTFLYPAGQPDISVPDLDQASGFAERILLKADQQEMPVLTSVSRVKFNGRDHLLKTFFDLSERKKMEKALESAYMEMDQIFQTASTAMRLISCNFDVMKVNKTYEHLTGVSAQDAVGKKCHEVFGGDLCFTPECPLSLILEGQKTLEFTVRKMRPDKTLIPCILTATPFTGTYGEIIGIVESFLDMTETEEAKRTILSERDKLDGILSNLAEGVCIINSAHTIEYQNGILPELIGEHASGVPCYTAFHGLAQPCSPCLMQLVIAEAGTKQVEFENPEGKSFEQTYTLITDVDLNRKAVVVTRDVTEEKNAMRAMMQTEQLAALGELSAGVAHEINNPINGIINYGQILKNKTEAGSLFNDIGERVVHEGGRIARIVEGLLSFARRRKEEKSVISINEALENSLMLTAAQLRKDNIIIRNNVSKDLPMILAQPHELEQVFINLISNARHALNDRYNGADAGKTLTIATEEMNTPSGPFLRISFHDTGIGIPPDIIDKIRNPFFSTKPDRKRTGLGLSISHGIIDKHGGKLRIESVQHHFTKVHVDLPTLH